MKAAIIMLLGLVISSSFSADIVRGEKDKTIITKGKIISWFNHKNELSRSVTYEIISNGHSSALRQSLKICL